MPVSAVCVCVCRLANKLTLLCLSFCAIVVGYWLLLHCQQLHWPLCADRYSRHLVSVITLTGEVNVETAKL